MTATALHLLGDGRDEVVDIASWQPRRLAHDELLWIDLTGPKEDEIEAVARALDLGDETCALLGQEPEVPDAIVLADAVSVVVSTPGPELDSEPVGLLILMGEEWVVTAHPAPIGFIDDHRKRLRDERGVGILTPVQFLVAVLDWEVDAFFGVAARLEAEVDVLDEVALRTDEDILHRLVRMRRRIARSRRQLWAHREVFADLVRPDFLPEMDDREIQALAAVVARLDRATDAVANAREMLIGTFDVHATRTAQRTNDIMKVLTLASAILLPASVIAGVMGMNFRIGFFEDPNMFWLVLAGMLVIAIGTLTLARIRNWL